MFRFVWRLIVIGCIMVTSLVVMSWLVEAEDGTRWGKYNNKLDLDVYHENVFTAGGVKVYCMWGGRAAACVKLY